MKKKAFISGPILGMETDQSYRKIITEICVKLGYDVLDPWQREKVLYKGDQQCWWDQVPTKGFIRRDLEDAQLCDVMIVYLPRLSAGACMELFYAKRKGKNVVVVSEIKCLSPWIVAHADIVVKDFSALEEVLKRLF
jgi:nucleoside 2-deoxyribosyltransferase